MTPHTAWARANANHPVPVVRTFARWYLAAEAQRTTTTKKEAA